MTLNKGVNGVSEQIEKMCKPLGVKTVTSSRSTLRSSLVKVKQPRPDRKKQGVVYEVLCKDCGQIQGRDEELMN